MFHRTCLVVALLCGGLLATSEAQAQKQDRVIVMKWSGSVEDEALQKDAPEVITNAKDLEKVWKAFKAEGKVPAVDFNKFFVVAVYSRGSRLNLGGAKLDDKGNLTVLGFGTRDLRPGFRYVLGMVSNDGVQSVNGKKLAAK
jgi:hypothetical protein